jgi:hypothetical protein
VRIWLPWVIVFLIMWVLDRLSRPKGKPRRLKLAASIRFLTGFFFGLVLLIGGTTWILSAGPGILVGILFTVFGFWFIGNAGKYLLFILGYISFPD